MYIYIARERDTYGDICMYIYIYIHTYIHHYRTTRWLARDTFVSRSRESIRSCCISLSKLSSSLSKDVVYYSCVVWFGVITVVLVVYLFVIVVSYCFVKVVEILRRATSLSHADEKMRLDVDGWHRLLHVLFVIRWNWSDTEKPSTAPAQGWHAQIEKLKC